MGIGSLVVVVLTWGRWMAPRASHRVGRPARPPLAAGFFLLAAALLALSGLPWPGLAMGVGALVLLGPEQFGRGPDEERRVREVRLPVAPEQRPDATERDDPGAAAGRDDP